MRPPRVVHRDRGLQPERTILAWNRTLLALVACGLLFLRWLPTHRVWALLPFVLAAAGALAIMIGRRRAADRTALAIHLERPDPPVGAVLSVTALVLVIGAIALVVV
ncbi:DUF202 domain-containing protein [Cumulibacter manganitolerans]|uniref:DUF202 domain-containing protein n=1 Tax=Cumulibacter manganitolerans TaxID=1884992 RepID=UPI0012967699|nr:DUF202 domain-containing protein [Cumulibacter manganitolerans]